MSSIVVLIKNKLGEFDKKFIEFNKLKEKILLLEHTFGQSQMSLIGKFTLLEEEEKKLSEKRINLNKEQEELNAKRKINYDKLNSLEKKIEISRKEKELLESQLKSLFKLNRDSAVYSSLKEVTTYEDILKEHLLEKIIDRVSHRDFPRESSRNSTRDSRRDSRRESSRDDSSRDDSRRESTRDSRRDYFHRDHRKETNLSNEYNKRILKRKRDSSQESEEQKRKFFRGSTLCTNDYCEPKYCEYAHSIHDCIPVECEFDKKCERMPCCRFIHNFESKSEWFERRKKYKTNYTGFISK